MSGREQRRICGSLSSRAVWLLPSMEIPMAIVTKTIRGRAYHYRQTSKRVGGKVKTTSVYIGPVNPKRQRKGVLGRIGEFITANLRHEHIPITEAELQKEFVRTKERDARRDQALDE